jgi:hypothetical protein
MWLDGLLKKELIMARKLSPTLLRLMSASRYLDVPASTLKYRVLTGDIPKHDYGPVWLVDVEEARSVLEGIGYYKRRRRGPVTV